MTSFTLCAFHWRDNKEGTWRVFILAAQWGSDVKTFWEDISRPWETQIAVLNHVTSCWAFHVCARGGGSSKAQGGRGANAVSWRLFLAWGYGAVWIGHFFPPGRALWLNFYWSEYRIFMSRVWNARCASSPESDTNRPPDLWSQRLNEIKWD